MAKYPESGYFTTSLAVKAFVEKPSGSILLLIAQDPGGNYFWDLPGGRVRREIGIAKFAIDKLNQEIPNLGIKDPKPELLLGTGEIEEITLNRKINGFDILFVGTGTKVSEDFEPKLSEHLGMRWINKEGFELLPEGDGTLSSPTLNPWLKNLAKTHFQRDGVTFHYQ